MSVFTATITSNGKTMDPAFQLRSIDVVREVNRVPYAQLCLIDGDLPEGKFPVSDSGFFDIGKKIEIKLRWEGDPRSEGSVFKGLVVAQRIVAENSAFFLNVELKSEAVKLTKQPVNKAFLKQTEDKALKNIIEAHGLRVGKIPATQTQHEEIVQYGCTDWDFILARADVNGLLVCVEDKGISLAKIELSGSAKKTFKLGIDEIYGLEVEADGENQFGDVTCLAWDMKNQKLTAGKRAKEVRLTPGDLDGKKIAGEMGDVSRKLAVPAPAMLEELQSWADAILARNRLSLIRGRISVTGFADIKLLDVIELKNVGKHFNGKALVTGWRHRLSEGQWITDLRLGLSADWILDRPDVTAKPASGLLPAVGGVQVGVVAAFEEDPEKHFRVKVNLPVLEKNETLWARLVTPDGGKGRGFFFRPEPGDEVVLGFFNDDPRQPVILGALYSSANTPPKGFEKLSDKNPLKGLVTKTGTKIAFDDKDNGKASISIETANKNKILLDDDGKSIQLTDQHGNVVTMDENGVTIKSKKNLTLKSEKNLTLEASQKVEIKGSSVDVK